MKFSSITLPSLLAQLVFFGPVHKSVIHCVALPAEEDEGFVAVSHIDTNSNNEKNSGLRGKKWNRSLFSEDIASSPGGDNWKQFLVKFKDHERFRNADIELQGDPHQIMSLPDDDVEVMAFESEEELQYWEQRDDVEYVEPDYMVELFAETVPYGINSVKALSVSDSNVSNRKVCIVDSGYDINHPDLQSSRSIVTGKNFSGSSDWNTDEGGHGTHVTGTIAAIGGNDQGVVGVNRNGQVKLHIAKVFGASGSASTSTVIQGFNECVSAGANVINMSLGGGGFSQTFNNAISSAFNRGILVVAAAGNDGNSDKSYPASYPAAMSVAAVDSSNRRASFSQFNDQVDIAAPGVGVLSTVPRGRYASFRGTSMASPHVAGVAALVWSHFPSKSAQEIRQALESTAQDLGSSGRDDYYGHGLVRADLAYNFLKGGGETKGTFIKSTKWNKFIRFNSDRKVDLTTNQMEWETIRLEKVDGDKYVIKSAFHSNMYLRVAGPGEGNVVNTQTFVGSYEKFYMERLEGGKVVAFKSAAHGNYLRARNDGYLDTQTYIGSWEQFAIIDNDDGNESALDGFDFYPLMDSYSNDIKHSSAGGMEELARECNQDPSCEGFNSNGWLKHTVRRQSEWYEWTSDISKGLYVKK